jgi:hypothetical protein
MKNIVKVDSPSFYINEDNPYEVSYDPNFLANIKWRHMAVGNFSHGLPKTKDSEILYLYETNRGCTIDGKQYRKNKIKQIINKLKTKN